MHRLELSSPGSARPPHGDAQVAAEVHVEQGRPGHAQGQQSGRHKRTEKLHIATDNIYNIYTYFV